MWNDLNCTYEDFSKGNAVILAKLAEVIRANPESLSSLRRAAFLMATGLKKRIGTVEEAFAAMGLREAEAPIVEELRASLTAEMLELVAAQRIAAMQTPTLFSAYTQDGKAVKRTVVKIMVGESVQDIRFGSAPDPQGSPVEAASAITVLEPILVSDVHTVAIGASSPMVMALKKPDPAITDLAFSIVLKSPTPSGEMTIDAVARDRKVFVNWTDGLRALTGQPLISPEASADAAKLAEMELRIRMVELDAVDVPSAEPERPPPPPFTFVVDDNAALAAAGLRRPGP